MNKNAPISDFENLLDVYNTVFASSYRGSAEGQKIKQLLTGRITVAGKGSGS